MSPVISSDKIADLRLKQLEMVQTIIARMANYGATLKNYCLTLVTAICGFSITLQRPLLATLAFLPIIMFALLDAQYLRLERRFRGLFDQLGLEDWASVPTFEINLNAAPFVQYWKSLRSWSVVIFYAPLLVVVTIVLFFGWYSHGSFI